MLPTPDLRSPSQVCSFVVVGTVITRQKWIESLLAEAGAIGFHASAVACGYVVVHCQPGWAPNADEAHPPADVVSVSPDMEVIPW